MSKAKNIGRADNMFQAATFVRQNSQSAAANDLPDDNVPYNLMNSKSNIPGVSAKELLASHRQSLMDLNENSDVDTHSVTLSRHQVAPEMYSSTALEEFPDDEYKEALESFKFGSADD